MRKRQETSKQNENGPVETNVIEDRIENLRANYIKEACEKI